MVAGPMMKVTRARCANCANVGVPPSSTIRAIGGVIRVAAGSSTMPRRHTSTRSSAGHSTARNCGAKLSSSSTNSTDDSADARITAMMPWAIASHGHFENKYDGRRNASPIERGFRGASAAIRTFMTGPSVLGDGTLRPV